MQVSRGNKNKLKPKGYHIWHLKFSDNSPPGYFTMYWFLFLFPSHLGLNEDVKKLLFVLLPCQVKKSCVLPRKNLVRHLDICKLRFCECWWFGGHCCHRKSVCELVWAFSQCSTGNSKIYHFLRCLSFLWFVVTFWKWFCIIMTHIKHCRWTTIVGHLTLIHQTCFVKLMTSLRKTSHAPVVAVITANQDRKVQTKRVRNIGTCWTKSSRKTQNWVHLCIKFLVGSNQEHSTNISHIHDRLFSCVYVFFCDYVLTLFSFWHGRFNTYQYFSHMLCSWILFELKQLESTKLANYTQWLVCQVPNCLSEPD